MPKPSLAALALLVPALSACVSVPKPREAAPPARPTGAAVPPQRQPQASTPARPGFIAPQVMTEPGLEGVIGRNATALANLFGPPRLDVTEGDAHKLQFAGRSCVLDIYLYPLRQGAEPSATHIEARRASDGKEVDRATCIAALRR